jgi:hypothetical protein
MRCASRSIDSIFSNVILFKGCNKKAKARKHDEKGERRQKRSKQTEEQGDDRRDRANEETKQTMIFGLQRTSDKLAFSE